jgi:hypothetical protein
VDEELAMAAGNAPVGLPEVSPAAPAIAIPASPSWPWRRAALFLAGAAQLITFSALVGVDPTAAAWSSLLLAVAPALLAAAAASAAAPVSLLAALAGVAVLVAGIAGQVTHTGLFFIPALAVLAVAAVALARAVRCAGEGVIR